MLYVLIPLGVAALSGVIYMALSKKSTFKVRIVALGALAVMVLVTIICIFIIFGGKSAAQTTPLPDALPSDIPPAPSQNAVPVIIFAIFLIALFILILIMSMREQRKSTGAKVEPIVKDNW